MVRASVRNTVFANSNPAAASKNKFMGAYRIQKTEYRMRKPELRTSKMTNQCQKEILNHENMKVRKHETLETRKRMVF